jgi:hypothetical protein
MLVLRILQLSATVTVAVTSLRTTAHAVALVGDPIHAAVFFFFLTVGLHLPARLFCWQLLRF